jgi:GTP-binding protein
MIIKSATFVKSALKVSHYPPGDLPEIAFAGRSNTGKSSLINTLLQRKNLVKTSSTPGRTQMINFFIINESVYFVDLPGYGYAKVPPGLRQKWGPMVETYLLSRNNLKTVIVTIDIRRTPAREETNLFNWLSYHKIPFLPVLTKSDKLSKIKQKTQKEKIAQQLLIPHKKLILFSAKTAQGKKSLWEYVDGFLSFKEIS